MRKWARKGDQKDGNEPSRDEYAVVRVFFRVE